MGAPPPISPLPPPQPPKDLLRPILITFLASILLSLGSCFGYIINFNRRPWGTLFMYGFFLGVFAFLFAIVALIVRAARRRR